MILHILSLFVLFSCYCDGSFFEPPCTSPIFCYGDLLKNVQLLEALVDRRAFFALKMKYSEKQILEDFELLHESKNLTKENVRDFVAAHFEDSNAIMHATATDYRVDPPFLKEIRNDTLRKFANDLHQLWPKLTRKFRKEVLDDPSPYSYIPVPNNFLVPGGRFSEYYYWDSYWIIEGLLISDMYDTARGIIDNFIHLVRKFGFVPNGGKIYYLNRSQPPLLTYMAYAYFKETHDISWLKKNIDFVALELQHWLKKKLIYVDTPDGVLALAQHFVRYSGPRPESYLNDYNAAKVWKSEVRREQAYMELKSAVETGWDFSTRWMFDQESGNVSLNISNIQMHRLIPVDLNAYLCGAFFKIAELYQIVGDERKGEQWKSKALEWRYNIDKIMWNSTDNIWYDYDTESRSHRTLFYPSNVSPLWANCYADNPHYNSELGRLVLDYLKREGVLDFVGGVPTSLIHSGQQWDFPNAWPPLQHLVVYALLNSGNPDAMEEGQNLASKWIDGNMLGFYKHGEMFEKYDAREAGLYGGGGEYPVQAGFGWSNGVVLKFIYDFF
ncbi:trehalase-like [Agrilus planipennis]|uniref:Trehalase n=1 Tax=Agrilus planipennis TaxID=224129 RepID=A0A1W4XCC1_AGRPL|nr:trehalase-like [Agrilus planipennis]